MHNAIPVELKKIVWLAFILVLLSTAVFVEFVKPVEASRTIFIKADGSVVPDIAPILSVDNVTYTFTGNINDSIVVERDDIIIDGAGYTVNGLGTGLGFNLTNINNVTIKNTKIKKFSHGVYLLGSSNNMVSGNNITNNDYFGVYLLDSSDNTVSGNVFVGEGLCVEDSFGSVVVDNLVNGKPLVYFEDVSDVVVEDAGQVILVNCNRIKVENLNLSHTSIGVELCRTNSTTLTGNNITNNNFGVYLLGSSNNMVSGNNITNNDYFGVCLLDSSDNNTFSGNNITNNDNGVLLLGSSDNNTFSGNNITNNDNGVHISDSSNNMVSGNNITNNDTGMWLSHSSDNSIIGNDVMNNQLEGIGLTDSTNNIIETNLVLNNGHGISLTRSDNNIVDNNPIVNNTQGIVLDSSHNNTLSGQHISINKQYGIYLCDSSNNTIYDILFINNTQQVYDYSWGNPTTPSSINIWDDGVGEGNYWSNYEERYPNATYHWYNGTAIWDTPYVIDENNQDNYPIVPEFPTWTPMLFILITLTVAIAIYKRRLLQTPITKQPSSKNVSMMLGPKLTFSIVLCLK